MDPKAGLKSNKRERYEPTTKKPPAQKTHTRGDRQKNRKNGALAKRADVRPAPGFEAPGLRRRVFLYSPIAPVGSVLVTPLFRWSPRFPSTSAGWISPAFLPSRAAMWPAECSALRPTTGWPGKIGVR